MMPRKQQTFAELYEQFKKESFFSKPQEELKSCFEELLEAIEDSGLPYTDTEKGFPSLPIYIREITNQLNRDDFYVRLLAFWDAWCILRKIESRRSTPSDLTSVDYFSLKVLLNVKNEYIQKLFNDKESTVNETVLLGKNVYKNDPVALELVGTFLTKLRINHYEAEQGREFLARAEYLRTKPLLKNDIDQLLTPYKDSFDETKKELAGVRGEAEEAVKILEGKTKEAKNIYNQLEDQTKRAEIRSIQVIAIFAALMAFIVATVPVAARVQELSLFLAIAGLGIILGGFLLLVAILFGGKNRPKWGWIGVPIALLILWLFLVLNPNLIKIKSQKTSPPADTTQVETPPDSTIQ